MWESACFDKQYVWRFTPQSDHGFQFEYRIARPFLVSHVQSHLSEHADSRRKAFDWAGSQPEGQACLLSRSIGVRTQT